MPQPCRLNHVPTPLHNCQANRFENAGIQVWIKRDDLNHPQIQGNKWHKLKLNLDFAQQHGYKQLLSFGGAYSNHIAALAAAGNTYGFETIGFIRGNELANNHQAWSATLKTAHQQGMQLHFLSRSEYRLRNDPQWLANLKQSYPNAYVLPEGGTNALAIAGFESVMNELQQQCDFSHLLCAVGTGGSLAGFINYSQPNQKIWGITTLKQSEYLVPAIQAWLHTSKNNWRLWTEFHGGGYGKMNAEIMNKYNAFEQEFNVLLDPVYTAKLVYGFEKLLQAGEFKRGSRVVLYHSGGLQGRH